MISVNNGSTSNTFYFVLRDSTSHAPNTGVTVTDIDTYYVLPRVAISAKTDCSALASASASFTAGGAYHVGQGLYRIDFTDSAFNAGIGTRVTLIVVCAGCDTTFLMVQLTPPVNATAISDDATVADALELLFDNSPRAAVTNGFAPSGTHFEATGLSAAINNFYAGAYCLLTSGTLAGQARKITAWDYMTSDLTVGSAFSSTPAVGTTFIILGRSGT
jgi:hypothetical protein